MKELDKEHENIDVEIMKQLNMIAGKLFYHSKPLRSHRKAKQVVVATPLKITKEQQGNRELLKLENEAMDVYFNFPYNESTSHRTNCNSNCIKKLNTLPTRVRKQIREGNNIHTEIQMLYKSTESILRKQENEDKIILVYSTYIPCSQNQYSNGGVFLECAGEMANFVVDKSVNTGNNQFIVFYDTEHSKGNTVTKVSQLYMELSGIVALKHNPDTNLYRRDERLLPDFTDYLRDHPVFLRLSRPLLHKYYRVTVNQLFVDCLARNSVERSKPAENNKEKLQFEVAKYQLYRAFSMNIEQGRIGKTFTTNLNTKYPLLIEERVYASACSKFAEAMSKDPVKKKSIIVKRQKADYFSFHFYTAQFTPKNQIQQKKLTFNYNSEKKECDKFLPTFIKRYKIEIEKSKMLSCKLYNSNNGYYNGYYRH